MPKLPDFGPLLWCLSFVAVHQRSRDVGAAWATADEVWTRYRERVNNPAKAPGRPAPKTAVKRRKK